MNEIARILTANILEAFPEWAASNRAGRPTRATSSDDETIFEVAPPAHPAHRLKVVLRGNAVEVRYDDSQPPGPAEKMFVDFDRHPQRASQDVVAFLRDFTEGRIVVARSPLGLLVRLMRGERCQSLAAFRSAREITAADAPRYLAIYRWLS